MKNVLLARYHACSETPLIFLLRRYVLPRFSIVLSLKYYKRMTPKRKPFLTR